MEDHLFPCIGRRHRNAPQHVINICILRPATLKPWLAIIGASAKNLFGRPEPALFNRN